MDMQTLRLFFDVARCHSFSQAAALHGITQSAASQRIGQLERKLHVTLLDRSTRPLALTEAGRLFLEGVGDVLERYDRLEQKVSALGEEPEGRVRVAAIYSAGIELLNQLSQRFEAEHPRIRIDLNYEKPDEVYRRVLEGECDLGILSYPQRWRKVDIVPLREEIMAVVCGPEHPLARRKRVGAGELGDYPMVTFDADLPVGRRLRQYLREQGVTPQITNVFDNIDTLKNAVAVTERFSILPVRTVLREVGSGALRVVELTPRMTRPIGVISRKGARSGNGNGTMMPAVRVFVDFLKDHAGPSVDVAAASLAEAGLASHLLGVGR